MHTYFSAELSVFRGGHHVRQSFVRRTVWLVVTFLFIGHMLLGVHFVPAQSVQNKGRLPKTKVQVSSSKRPAKSRRQAVKKKAATAAPAYDCLGRIKQPKYNREYLERALDDALVLLKKCEPCRRMFDSEDPDYAIELLQRLRRDKVIVISEDMPDDFRLSADRTRITVKTTMKVHPAGAQVRDLAGSRPPGEMQRPCIYVNPKEFIVTGRRAEDFALYRLKPPIQRAVAILHELGHVAGVLQQDGLGSKELRNKSVENTNCVRKNCTDPCTEFEACPNAPKVKKRRRPRKRSTISHVGVQRLPLASLRRIQ